MRQLKIVQSITNRESFSFEKYLQEISKVDMIHADEEAELARRIREGDQAATDRLVKANLRFVVSVAKQYQYYGLPISDMVNEGNLGLIKAAQRFDESKGFKFISYAVWWIRQGIVQAIADQGRLVRVPSNKLAMNHKIQRTYCLLEQENERPPSAEELAEAMEMNVDEVTFTLACADRHTSLDSPVGDDAQETLLSRLENKNIAATDEDVLHIQSLRTEINRSLQILSDIQKEVLRYSFGLGVTPMSLEEIGQKHNLTAERVRQIKTKAIARLRAHDKSLLKSYLGN